MGDNVKESADRGLVLETVFDHNKPGQVDDCLPEIIVPRHPDPGRVQTSEQGPGFVPKGSHTHEYYEIDPKLPKKFDNPEWLKGYGGIPQHPLYMTTSNDYGKGVPNVHTSQTKFRGSSQAFTLPLGKSGMYRDHGLNTSLDKSYLPY